MKIFKLKKVSYKNIMSVGQKPIVIELDKVHKTLITGKNGAGKSTMLEAITFALFGKPFRDVKKGQLINSSNKKDLLVELEMEYDNHTYFIRRGQKPNIFEITRDGERLDEAASSKDFQAYFEDLIGMSYNSFKQIVVLGTAGYTPFMSLSAPTRRKLVEDLLEVSVLAEMDKLNKTTIRDINQSISVLDMKVDHIRTEITTHKEYAERQKKLSGDNVARLQKMYDDNVAEVHQHKDAIAELSDKIAATILPENPSDKATELSSKEAQYLTTANGLKKVLSLYEKGGSCPTCMQQLDTSSSLVYKVKERHDEVHGQYEMTQKERQSVALLTEEYKSVAQKIRDYQAQQANHKELAIAAAGKAKKIKAAIAEAQKEFIDNSDKIEALQEESSKIIDNKTNLVMEKYHRGIITEMLKDSGIKGAIIKKYIPLFNKQINNYLKAMEADYVFTLNEEFSETIKSRGREDFSYASFSQGEKGRIDIALLFTWRDIAELVSGVKISCLFLDEIFDSCLDVQAMNNLMTILNGMKDTNIFVISHRDQDTQKYDCNLIMNKVGRFTVQN